MTRYLMVALLAVLFISLTAFAPPVHAMSCGDRIDGITELKDRYGEEPAAMGLTSSGEVIELFISENGTFTIITTGPDGLSCLMLSGDSWESMPLVNVDAVES